MKRFLFLLTIAISINIFAGGIGGHEHAKKHGDMGHDKSAVGEPALAEHATKIIALSLLDTMRFEFDAASDIKADDVVTFIVTNKGKIRHEFSIGNADEQKRHAQMMQKMPDMMHEDGNTVTVEPGETKEITWLFKGKETVVFACNIPGHFEAGMKVSVQL